MKPLYIIFLILGAVSFTLMTEPSAPLDAYTWGDFRWLRALVGGLFVALCVNDPDKGNSNE